MKHDHECIQCGTCQSQCLFLEKYDLTIADREELKRLAYHCFLCGVCSQVCPQGIDGREVLLQMRRDQVADNGGRLAEPGYGLLVGEKKNYLFRNYRHARGKSLLFPGCNFPSFYPRTSKKLAGIMESFGIGLAYDCCGKPIAELGLDKEAQSILDRLQGELDKRGVEELVMVCPNCYAYLKDSLSVRIVTIYEKMKELGFDRPVRGLKGGKVFLPCPDRKEMEILDQLAGFYGDSMTPLKGVQCCGLGGCASGKEPDLLKQLGEESKRLLEGQDLIVYCASCAGALGRQGITGISHALCQILETREEADLDHSLVNRARCKWG